MIIPQAQAYSNLQHKHKSYMVAHVERDFNPLGTLLDMCNLYMRHFGRENPVSLEDGFGVLKGVTPADSVLMCRTE